ncbi:hypothetical protein LCGC14_1974450 [marine sediment metagenome]|uniref:Uncharacterized protein n=1 Tax=marine sediment metagenome TaxID=412755 RepID=A0A0F9FAR8_9ZZZZ
MFRERNCAHCDKQDYAEEMIYRLESGPNEPIPCKELIHLLGRKQYEKLVFQYGNYKQKPGDCPKYKPEAKR